MPQMVDEAGNLWNVDAQGNPISFAGRQQQQQAIAPNPVKVAAASADLTGANLSNVGKGIDNTVAAGTQAAQIAKANADAQRAQIDLQQAQQAAAAKPNPATARAAVALGNDEILTALANAQRGVSGWSTGLGGQYLKTWGGTDAKDLSGYLSTISSRLTVDKLSEMKSQSPTGASGMGALSEKEGALLRDSVAGLDQDQSPEKVRESLAAVELHYRRMRAIQDGQDPSNPEVAKRYGVAGVGGAPGIGQPGGPGAGGGPPMGLTSQGQMVADPALKGANAHVRQMLTTGKSPAEVQAYLRSLGQDLPIQNIEQASAYARQHPGDKSDWLNVDLEKRWKPASGVSSALGAVGMTAPGSAVIGAADTLSMGTLDNLTGNPEMTRAVMGGLQQANPNAYAVGQVGGGALASIAGEAALARAGVGGIAGSRIADGIMGAGYKAGSADGPKDSRIAQALLGAGEGVAGGMAGRGIARGAGRLAQGVGGVAQRTLNAAGVRMTPGQILGGAAKSVEDRLAGLPIVGGAINARRREGIQDFNRAAFQQAVDPINGQMNGEIAETGIETARRLRSAAYGDALDGVHVQADVPFVQDMQGVIAQGRALPDPMRANLDYTLPTRVGNSFDVNGGLTGDAYQQSLRGLRRDANSMESLPYGHDFADVTRGAEDALGGLLDRQAPGVTGALRTANEVNRNVETLRSAVNASRNGARSHQPGLFMPSQLADAAAANAKKYGNSHGTTQQPFFDLSRAGQEALPNQIPDSGTAGRIAMALGIGSLGGGGSYAAADGNTTERAGVGMGGAALAATIAAVPYSRAARASVQQLLMAQRPQAVEQIGQQLLAHNRIAGLLAAPGAVIYGNEP